MGLLGKPTTILGFTPGIICLHEWGDPMGGIWPLDDPPKNWAPQFVTVHQAMGSASLARPAATGAEPKPPKK